MGIRNLSRWVYPHDGEYSYLCNFKDGSICFLPHVSGLLDDH